MIARAGGVEFPEPGGVIRIRGARQHNLRSIDLDLPLHRLIVITGVSGSGKSSLAFDTLYAEGQRRYVETFSAYTRQFLDRMARPDADLIEGIPPAVAIDQSGAVKTSRSTVGTMTGVNDYLKLLFARFAVPFCAACGREAEREDAAFAVKGLESLPAEDFPLVVAASVELGGLDDPRLILTSLRARGHGRFLRGKEILPVEEIAAKDLRGKSLSVVVDRLAFASTSSRRAEAVEAAFRVGRGRMRLLTARGAERIYREGIHCGGCDREFLRPTPGLFSFNTPFGACPDCRGFGRVIELDLDRVIPDPSLSLRGGAIKPWSTPSRRLKLRRCLQFCEERGIPVDTPFEELPEEAQRLVIDGKGSYPGVRGFFRRLEQKKYKMHVRVLLSRYRGYALCPRCRGRRLREEALPFRVRGKTLPEIWDLPVHDLADLLGDFAAEARMAERGARLVLDEIRSRVGYLRSVGLGYLTLGRQSRSLSGGEVERVNLTSALGASLVESLFVLDEPSIGLHARDNARLLEILRAIRDRGNTVVVVEHDPEILRAADHVVDLGPGSGEKGGRIVAQGSLEEIGRAPASRTGAFLSGREGFEARRARRRPSPGKRIAIRGAAAHNLKSLDVDLPLGLLVAITGVSGSGKSTLIEEVLYRNARAGRRGSGPGGRQRAPRGGDGEAPGALRSIRGLEQVDEVILVDQSSLGRTSRGNPATYTGVFDAIRKRFAESADAVRAGLAARDFSFNVEGGRCPECAGAGSIDVEMQFLSDVSLPCESCGGKRFREEVLRSRLRGRSVHEVLELTASGAAEFFSGDPAIEEPLRFLESLGLGYLRLGQPLNTLSGGEAQRLKLAARVMEARSERYLFLLDEPTTGLHLADVKLLLEVLQGLVDRGHSVAVIEHHLEVIRASDWIIDLGPEGGDGGGELVAAGTPEEVMASPRSITGEWLRRTAGPTGARPAPDAHDAAGSDGPGAEASPAAAIGAIRVVGARENNLRDITVSIPRDRLVVVTGMSGSGKSSLLYDIVFAEGQRRYLDCLSPYARQFVEELHRPDLDHLEGIPPAVAIEQRTTSGGRKSTVGTVTEIYQFLRLLFARAGLQHCPDCGEAVAERSLEEIRTGVRELAAGRGGRLLAQAVRGKKGHHAELLRRVRRLGVLDARIDGEWVAIPEEKELRLERHRAHDIDLVVSRYRAGPTPRGALEEAVDLALDLGEGTVRFLDPSGEEMVFSRQRSCPACRRDFEPADPRNFSFNSRHGACPECDGYGFHQVLDPERLVGSWQEPLSRSPGGPLAFLDESPFSSRDRRRLLRILEEEAEIDPGRAPASLGARQREALLLGKGEFPGLLPFAEERLAAADPETAETFRLRHGKEEPCAACAGSRLRRESAAVRVGERSIGELVRQNAAGMAAALSAMRLQGRAEAIARPVVAEILARLAFLEEVGLGYLSIDRSVDTLSGGEAQRIRLAAQLGSNLRGACYILDEPTIGLHPVENERLIGALRRLRDRGNSVLVIEHDEATIAAADHLIELGPGPGRQGGRVVAQGTMADLMASPDAPTGRWFRERGTRRREISSDPLAGRRWLEVRGARLHNLRGFAARFPLGALTVVTGMSGSGKSTLVREVLLETVRARLRGLRARALGCEALEGAESLGAAREVDQMPIGRTPRSTPATYIGFWSRIRSIFAATSEARARGYGPARFSFNVKGGRCERCLGQGTIRMEMSFLPDVHVDCDRCRGERFESETLQVTCCGLTIGQVLRLTVDEAKEAFGSFPDVARALGVLADLGLGYLALGQASNTLSGGEAERLKLAVELAKTSEGATLYVLDEPTIGLHLSEVAGLVEVLRRLRSQGHAVVVIEHNLEVVAGADWVIDLGPGGGESGGNLLYQGPPHGLLDHAVDTPTAMSLRKSIGHKVGRQTEPSLTL